VGSTSN
jgi:hypothetical protein